MNTQVGEQLRQKREAYGWSLMNVAQHLRIRASVLAALESGEKEFLPSLTFAKGFVRSYADFLGLNAQEIAQRFEEDWYAQEKEESADTLVVEPPKRNAERRSFFTGPIGVPTAGVAALLLIGLWVFYENNNGQDTAVLQSHLENHDDFQSSSVQSDVVLQEEPPEESINIKDTAIKNTAALPSKQPLPTQETSSISTTPQKDTEKTSTVQLSEEVSEEEISPLPSGATSSATSSLDNLIPAETRIKISAAQDLNLIVYEGEEIYAEISLEKGKEQALPEGKQFSMAIEVQEQSNAEEERSSWHHVQFIVDGWKVATPILPTSDREKKLILDSYAIVIGIPDWSS